jgi:predicted NAD/FAD-dependent oxidoreductase
MAMLDRPLFTDWDAAFSNHGPLSWVSSQAARQLPGAQPFEVLNANIHRWRYALAREPLNQGAFWFRSKRLAVAGDWCHGSRVEGAFLSGMAAAGRVMGAATAVVLSLLFVGFQIYPV